MYKIEQNLEHNIMSCIKGAGSPVNHPKKAAVFLKLKPVSGLV